MPARTEKEPAAVSGLTTIPSGFGPAETMDRLVAAVMAKGLTVFARIDHAAGAIQAGLTLRPTALLIFGNVKGGTPLMRAAPTIGIDLPLRVLVWQDESRKTWLSHNDPAWLAARHGVGDALDPAVSAVAAMLDAIMKNAILAP